MTTLTPDAVMAQIAAALPDDCMLNVIIIGSLAAGYHFFAGDGQRSIRTKVLTACSRRMRWLLALLDM